MGHLVSLKLAFSAEDAFDRCRATRSRSELRLIFPRGATAVVLKYPATFGGEA